MALIKVKELSGDSKLGLWKIEEEADALLKQLKLSDKEKTQVDNMNSGKRYLHWLGSRVLLKKMLKTTDFVDLQVDEFGKPILKKHKYNISISHSGDIAAVLISKKGEVGIDVEKVEPRIERVAHKFMSREELDSLKEEREVEQMYMYWTAKEALYKVYGKKKLAFKENLPIGPFSLNGARKVKTTGKIVTTDFEKDYNINFEMIEDYIVAYVIDAK